MSEIEKQFMEVFGIEPQYKICPFHHCIYKKEYDCDNCDDRVWEYPQITDHILLELICLNNIYLWEVHTSTVNELKNVLLDKYIEHVNLMADENEKREYINQVQVLFRSNNYEIKS